LYSLLGRPTGRSEGLKLYPWTFFPYLSIHRAQQPRSGWPSNEFRRFGRSQDSSRVRACRAMFYTLYLLPLFCL